MLGGCSIGLYIIVLLVGVLDMSGWMIMGLFGFVYSIGLLVMWIIIGLILGVYINYFVVVFRFCVYIELVGDVIILLDFFKNCLNDKNNVLKIIFGLIIVVFFILYIYFGFVFGGKLFESVFGLDYYFGLILVVFIVIFYIFFGGYLVVLIIDFF